MTLAALKKRLEAKEQTLEQALKDTAAHIAKHAERPRDPPGSIVDTEVQARYQVELDRLITLSNNLRQDIASISSQIGGIRENRRSWLQFSIAAMIALAGVVIGAYAAFK